MRCKSLECDCADSGEGLLYCLVHCTLSVPLRLDKLASTAGPEEHRLALCGGGSVATALVYFGERYPDLPIKAVVLKME